MRGPAAPKDPVEKRPCLYVVLDKTISGSKDPEGVIRDYVYLEGRLKDQVKFTSGDIDEELLDMIPRMETFRKLFTVLVSVSRRKTRQIKKRKSSSSSSVMEKLINTRQEL